MKLFRKKSINAKLSILVISILFISLISVTVLISTRTYSTIDNLASNNSKEITKQVVFNYEAYFDEMRDLTRYLDIEISKSSTITQESLGSLLNSFSTTNLNILSINILNEDGIVFVSSKANNIDQAGYNNVDWFQDSIANNSVYFFTVPMEGETLTQENENLFVISKGITYFEEEVMENGVLELELSFDKIETLANQTNFGDFGHLIIFDEEDHLIYASNDDCIDDSCESVQLATDIIIGSDVAKIGTEQMIISVNTIQGTRWRIATFSNITELSDVKLSNNLYMIAVILVASIVTISLSSLLTKQVTKPLNELKNHMSNLRHSDHLYQEVKITGQQEIVVLADAYNDMIREIRRLLNRLVEEQNEKRKTELIALQTQINPHFLYNTLDSIVWLSEKKENEKVIDMVIALSRFFRISISRGRDIIDLDMEIKHAKYYLRIQKIRYSDAFDYVFDVDADILKEEVVKLVIQPLLENAINHGMQPGVKGSITLKAYKLDNVIHIAVTNSGYGLTDDQITEIYRKIEEESHQSIGLKNVVQRLKLYYGKQSGLHIKSEIDVSTTFEIYYPSMKGIESDE